MASARLDASQYRCRCNRPNTSSGKFRGGRQTGYERQHSDQNERALHSRLYRLVRIAQTMTWSK
jgi:hypothetical protein